MKPFTRLYLFVGVLALAAMACGTSTAGTGGDSGDPNLLFQDDFSNTSSGWDRTSNVDGKTDYENGQYQIALYSTAWLMWANPGLSFTDVIVEVDATMAGSTAEVDGEDDNNFGIICRHQDVDNFYVLVISSDGYYGIRKRVGGGEMTFIGLDGMDTSDAINQGNATNRLRAECIGSTLRLIVNGQTLLEVQDTSIASGDAGLMAGTFSATSTNVLFDNFTVRKP